MFASSSNEIKIWNLETFELISEYPVLTNKISKQSEIKWFNIKADSKHLLFSYLICFQISAIFLFLDSQIASVVNRDKINLINLDTNTQVELKETVSI